MIDFNVWKRLHLPSFHDSGAFNNTVFAAKSERNQLDLFQALSTKDLEHTTNGSLSVAGNSFKRPIKPFINVSSGNPQFRNRLEPGQNLFEAIRAK